METCAKPPVRPPPRDSSSELFGMGVSNFRSCDTPLGSLPWMERSTVLCRVCRVCFRFMLSGRRETLLDLTFTCLQADGVVRSWKSALEDRRGQQTQVTEAET